MIRTILDYLKSIITSLTASITIYITLIRPFAEIKGKNEILSKIQGVEIINYIHKTYELAIITILGFAIFIIFYFVENLYLRVKIGYTRKYGNVFGLLNQAINEISILNRKKFSLNKAKFHFEIFCSYIAEAFSIITHTQCFVSIKILGNYKNNLYAITFARDISSKKERKEADKQRKIIHWVQQNTGFKKIFMDIASKKKTVFFLSNNLPFKYNYENTYFEIYGTPHEGIPLLELFKRFKAWPLPYISTLVVPICPIDKLEQEKLIGFVCIDSNCPLVFKKKFDVDLLTGIANNIYNTIEIISKT